MSLETVESKYLDGSARLNCSDETAAMIDDEVKELLKECFEEAKKLLSENRDVLDEIAKYLYEKETITGKQFMEIPQGKRNPGTGRYKPYDDFRKGGRKRIL